MSYYEHEIIVRVIDGVLSHEEDWGWFIQHTEETFDIELKGDSLNEALHALREVSDVFSCLRRIREVVKKPLPITKEWLKELDVLAQFYNGTIDLCDVPVKSNFSIIMRLLIYAGKIYGQDKKEDYIYYVDIFLLRNLSSLEKMDMFISEEDKILQLMDEAPEVLQDARKIFLDNINGVTFPANQDFLERHKDELDNANCFSYTRISNAEICVWEERELLKMLSVSFRDGNIIPRVSWGETFDPDYTRWTRDRLLHIREFFASPIVTFVVETIGYLLHGDIPSAYTINRHFELMYQLSEGTEENYSVVMNCSSLEVIRLLLSRKCTGNISADSHKKFSKVLNKLYQNNGKVLLRKLLNSGAITDKHIIKKLHEEIALIRDRVGEISNYEEFTKYIENEFIRGSIANNHFETLSAKFETIAGGVDSVRVAHLFLEYFEFLLQIKNNKDIIAKNISYEILRIRKLWQEQYFAKSCQGMRTVKTDPILIPKDYSERALDNILLAPNLFAAQCMKLEDASLVGVMQDISDSPFSMLISKIMVNEDFPAHPICKLDGKHPIDIYYKDNIERLQSTYEYRFRNSFSAIQYTEGIFARIQQEMKISLELLNDVQRLYEAVVEQNKEYVFLEYSNDLCLAHLTQLFPILENKIRKFGELFGIVPVREKIDECHRLKEPDTVLKMIIQYVLELGGSMEVVSDMFFIHFCMFAENGMNIRNECAHGLGYCRGNQLRMGFKAALLSLYMVGWRMNDILDNAK